MGTKRPNWTLYDPLSNINMSDHKLQPGGKISRDPSPKPAKTAQSDREREIKRVEDRRRDRENERMRDKERHRDLDPQERYCERERAPAPRPPREGERGWREMEKRQENDRGKNGRPLSNIEKANEREVERGMKKGETFPRITKNSADGAKRMMPTTGLDEERLERRQRERVRQSETDDWEKERDRVWQRERQGGGERYRERERDAFRSRGKEVRLVEDEKLKQREKYRVLDGGLQDKRERYATNKRGREREAMFSSPHRRRDRDVYSDRKEKEKTQRREGKRVIRSEGDSDEREFRRERMKEREREELTYQQSRSEGENKSKTLRERDQERQRYREHDRQKYRDREGDRSKWEEGKRRGVDRERYRDHDRRTVREGEHKKESLRDFKDDRSDRREDDQHREREREQRGRRERKGREADPRWDEMTGRSNRTLNETDPRVPPRAQSSGEWSSDMDSEPRRGRDSYEERESGRESTTESERDKWSPERTAERRRREQHRSERSDRDRREMAGSVPEQRRMWFNPQRGKNSQVSSLEEESEERDAYRRQKEGQRQLEGSVASSAEFLREGRHVKEETDERYSDHSSHRGRQKESGRKDYKELKVEETESVSVDREVWRETDRQGKGHLSDSDGGMGGSWQRDTEGENVTDNTEDSDREEEGGSDYARSESEGGSERGWRQERVLSGEDGFVTVSSGGDEEDEREEDEEEEEFEDCVEFWEGEIAYDEASRFNFREYEGDEEREEEWTMGKDQTVGEEDKKDEREQRGKKPKYVFCVIGQTLPRSKPDDKSQSHVDQMGGAERDESNLQGLHYVSDDVTLQPQPELKRTRNDEHAINNQDVEAERNSPREEQSSEVDRVSSEVHDRHDVAMRSKVVHHYPEMGTLKRDSQTERLLVEWRERIKECSEETKQSLSPIPSNPYGDVCTKVSYEQIQPMLEAMSPEEVEAIRIRMSGTWSISEETKRHSQAPHLKWAKNVISEILGHSTEEQTDENPYAEVQQNQGINQSVAVIKDDEQVEETAQRREEIPVVKVKLDGHSDPELLEEEEEEEVEPLEVEGLRDEEDGRSKSWSEVDLRNVLDTIGRRKRNSKFFNAAQLYQQYSEAAQNFEILRQARSDVVSVCEDASASPAPSPPPARRPLPPLPPVPHPHSLSHTGSVTSVRSLPLPEPPRSERRASSPRLSSIGQSATLWRDLPAVRNSTELEELTEDERRLQEVRFEVVTSEASYCRSLDIVVEHFVKSKQLGALLTTQDRNWLFSRLADVRAISHSFLSKLEEQVESDILHFTVCDVIARHCQRFKMVYVPYLTNQSYQDATYQRLMNENQGFKRTVEKLERSPVCQRLPLRSFLVLPFQRITRIKLLVQNIVKRTTPGTAEATQAIKALKLLEKLIQESNDSITQMKSIESLVSLSAKVDFECRTLPLISQSRRMVREGQVTELMDFSLKETERNIYMHLFNDYLLLSLQKEGGRFTVIDHAPVSDLRAENCRVKLHSLQKNLFRLHMSHKALLLRTDTQSDKLRWISALSRPHAEVDFSAAQDFPQMQCIRAFVAQQPDELSLEKADVILVHQQSSDHWVEGTRLSDRHRGWIPESHLETITNSRVLQRNLSDALKLTTATAAV